MLPMWHYRHTYIVLIPTVHESSCCLYATIQGHSPVQYACINGLKDAVQQLYSRSEVNLSVQTKVNYLIKCSCRVSYSGKLCKNE